ncbi:MAG TPA: wax ester/triacylglycerol synthase family O-acyltransferase [Thermoleophilaceae bacterium]|jgi:WS/DGAT/MGAT family acyltransferase
MSALDASFLRVESPVAHMHVGWFSALELPRGIDRLDAGALIEQIESRLHLAPRFRQRVVEAPLGVAEPGWRDDPSFRIADHVNVHPGGPLSPAAVRRVVDDFLSEQLPRDRPLWSLLVLPAVDRRRAAVIGKVHHAMVDGLAAVELGLLLFDAGPEATPVRGEEWRPESENGPVRVLLDSLADSAVEQFRTARRVASLGLSPGEGIRMASTLRKAAFSLAEDTVRPAPPSSLNVPIGPRRTLVKHRVSMARMLRMKQHGGASLNDVVLAVSAGALRRLALRQGEEATDLRVMVPVSVRREGDDRGQGNRITFAFVDLPAGEPSPAARLERVRDQMGELKDSGRVAGTEILLRSVGSLPEPLKKRAARLAASPRLYNLTISNVPGPRIPLYAGGARVRSIYPVIPIPEDHALSLGVLSYDDGLHFAAYADPKALPEVRRLPSMLEEAVEELSVAVAPRERLDRPRRRRGAHTRPSLSSARDG